MDKKKYQRLKPPRRARPVSERLHLWDLVPSNIKGRRSDNFLAGDMLAPIGKFNELSTTFDMLEMPISRTLR